MPSASRAEHGDIEIIDARADAAAAALVARWVHEEWGWRVESAAETLAWHRQTFLDHDRPFPLCLVARLDGAPVGTASLTADDGLGPPFDEASGATPWLAAVFTTEAARGRGVASALIAEAVSRARTQGLGRLWLYTAHAADLYARFGFLPVARARSREEGAGVTVMRAEFEPARASGVVA